MEKDLWDKVCTTKKENTKEVSFGRKFTAIDAYSQIEKATELWGSFGNRWGVTNEQFNYIEKNNIVFYTAILYYPVNEKKAQVQIHADIETVFNTGKRAGTYNEDFTKKVATDALTKGLSKLGFNADIFLGTFNGNKYVEQESKKETKPHEDPKRKQLLDKIKENLVDSGNFEPYEIKEYKVKTNNADNNNQLNNVLVEIQSELNIRKSKQDKLLKGAEKAFDGKEVKDDFVDDIPGEQPEIF